MELVTQFFKKNRKMAAKFEEMEIAERFDILQAFMTNPGLKHIADKIFSLLDMFSLAECRVVSRTYRDYLDNERSMLQLQIRNFKSWSRFDQVFISKAFLSGMAL